MKVIERQSANLLFEALKSRGYELVGPTVRDQTIVYDRIEQVDDLPVGWTDEQDAGHYSLKARSDGALFGYTVGPHAWKRFLYPPKMLLWKAEGSTVAFEVQPGSAPTPRYAFIGVRACELQAMAIQDAVFLKGTFVDTGYRDRRENAFVVAVNCGTAGGTCFCASMNAGPKATAGFDLALTEFWLDGRHALTIEAGSDRGREVLDALPVQEASPAECEAAEAVVAQTAQNMGRRLETEGLREALAANPEHPRWSKIAERCMSCANCTMVCPTCFCSTVEDVTDLSRTKAERWRLWDSCFTMSYSYIHGGNIRKTSAARYRQWLTHKLSSWIDQFGMSGCVGCGRCITWCPVGIDITEEARAIRENKPAVAAMSERES